MTKRIVLAEDEPQIAGLVEFKLKKEGYHKNMWFDELQAYVSVGDWMEMKRIPAFAKHFDSYLEKARTI